jgi:hypothetical protein
MWVERPNDDAARIPRRPDADAEPNGSAERNADADADADPDPDPNTQRHPDAASRHRWLTPPGADPDDHRRADRQLADPNPDANRDIGLRSPLPR